MVRTRVERSPTSSTVPSESPILQKSPTRIGLSTTIMIVPNTFSIVINDYGLELLSILITNNSISEANLLGFGSAIAVVLLVISLVPIIIFLTRTMREDAE